MEKEAENYDNSFLAPGQIESEIKNKKSIKIEYFDTKEDLDNHFKGIRERSEKIIDNFRIKYRGIINCEELFKKFGEKFNQKDFRGAIDLKNEFDKIEQEDFDNLYEAFASLWRKKQEEEKYTFKGDPDNL